MTTDCKNWLLHLKVGVLGPLSVLPKLPTMISPECNDGGVGETKIIKGIEHPADLKVDIGHRRVVGSPGKENFL